VPYKPKHIDAPQFKKTSNLVHVQLYTFVQYIVQFKVLYLINVAFHNSDAMLGSPAVKCSNYMLCHENTV